MRKNTYEFTISPSVFGTLTANERAVLPHIIFAVRGITPLYKRQKNPKFLGANFYPHDATKLEIEYQALQNPSILSPYTFVERTADGVFTTVPFHNRFQVSLNKIAKQLLKASITADDHEFSKYLQMRAHALTDGVYEDADIVWLTSRLFPLNVMLGPIERYDDHLFFKKCAYRGWVSILNKELTEEANHFKEVMYQSHQPLKFSSQVAAFNKTKVRVDDPLLFSGQIAENMVISTNLPNDVRLIKEHGSVVTIFSTVIMNKFYDELLPLYNKLFAESFRESYPIEIIKRAALRHAYLHELAHPLGRYLDAEERLNELFPIFDESFATIMGARSAGTLFLKDFISQKELESSIIMLLLQAYFSYKEAKERLGRTAYMKGYVLAVNYLFESGALREANGKLWPNFAKVYVCLEELCRLLENILAHGSYDQAQAVVQQFVKPEAFERAFAAHGEVKLKE